MLAVQVLVEAVIVACAVAKEERRRSRLAGFVAAGEKSGMGFRKVDAEAERAVPAVGDRREVRIKRGPQIAAELRQRIGEIAVLTPADAVPPHRTRAPQVSVHAVKPSHFTN